MKKRLKRIAALKAGVVFAVIFGSIGFLSMIITALSLVAGNEGAAPASGRALFFFLGPSVSVLTGFIVGFICATLYNLAARWTGGIDYEVDDVE